MGIRNIDILTGSGDPPKEVKCLCPEAALSGLPYHPDCPVHFGVKDNG